MRAPYLDDGDVRLYLGEAVDVLRDLPDASVDVVMTDPPYSSGGLFRSDRSVDPAHKYRGFSFDKSGSTKPKNEYGSFGGDNRDQRSFLTWVAIWTAQALRVTRPGGHIFLFSDWRQLPLATDAVQLGGWSWRGICVWDKGIARPISGRFRQHIEFVVWATHGPITAPAEKVYPSSVIQVPTVTPSEREHVTQKPVALVKHLLSVVDGGRLTVLDPFAGSGTTLVAAREAGHQAIGVEVERRYCDMAAKRLAQRSLLGDGEAA